MWVNLFVRITLWVLTKKGGKGWGYARLFFCASGLGDALVAIAVSRRLTSDNVIAPLPARAACAFSNSWLLSRTYVRKFDERHAPMRIISLSVRPAAASVDAPPIRNECVDMRVASMPR